jgi:hypothetical protein
MYSARVGALWSSNPCSPLPSCLSGRIFRTNDGATTWTDITSGLAGIQWAGISDIAVNPNDADEIWVSFENSWDLHRVSYSNDGGNNWSNYSTGLPAIPISTIIYQEGTNDRLFVGTDVGVYYRDKYMNSWECYSENLPIAIVAKLDINNCSGIMYAATHGRAIWQTPLPGTAITSNTTWDGLYHVGNTITVSNNAYLIVTGTLKMGKNAKIIVEAGSSLLIMGGKIEANSDCGELWQGIEMNGDKTKDQTYANQPYVYVGNGGEISGAKVAIRNAITDAGGIVDLNTTGGWFLGEEATFRNNLVDVKYHPYQNFIPSTNPLQLLKDKTVCNQCSFISDVALPHSQYTAVHIDLDGIDGFELDGVTIDNQLAQTTLSERGIGIKAYSSSIHVNPSGSLRSKFKDLYMAIENWTFNPIYTPQIAKADFIDNVKGVYLGGNHYASITENEFKIYDDVNEEPYGIYLDYCTDYKIEENTFSNYSYWVSNTGVGIVVTSSGDYMNEVYRNDFSKLNTATLVQGDNRKDDHDGLEILCNDYENNSQHIALVNVPPGPFGGSTLHPEIAPEQGYSFLPTDPAGNVFTNLCTGSTQTDIFVDNGGHIFKYFHYKQAKTIPYCRTTSKVTNSNSFHDYTTRDEVCPSQISSGGGGGGPWGPGLSVGNDGTFLENLQSQLGQKSKSSNSKKLRHYIQWHLQQDTIQMDSVILALAVSANSKDRIRMLAAMARRGDTTYKQKSLQTLLEPEAKLYGNFLDDLAQGTGKVLDAALADYQHECYIWAKARDYHVNGNPIPAPIEYPRQNIVIPTSDESANQLTIYPNPANEVVHIIMEGKGIYEIFFHNMQGQIIKSLTLNQQTPRAEIKVAELPTGVYLLKIQQNGALIATERLGIQH